MNDTLSRRQLLEAALSVGTVSAGLVRDRAADTFPVSVSVDASDVRGAWNLFWRFFGCDEPNYAYLPHGAKLVAELGKLRPKQVFFRAHNLLTTGDGTPALKWGSTNAYTEDAEGRPVYDWTILDRIFDTYRERGVRPYVQIGFMPQALSARPEPYRHHWTPHARYDEIFTGWAYPPRDYRRWAELVYEWANHCVQRYGRSEVTHWYWEVWNEPNIGYWRGTPEEFYQLHDYAVDAVRRAVPAARVGGPDVAGSGGRFMQGFLEHCLRGTNYATGHKGTPLDFVSFHAKGAPEFAEGHVRMGIANQLRTIDEGFGIIGSYPELKGTPIVIGEWDPDGCAACQGPQLAYRNGALYASYTAAAFARTLELAARHGVHLDGALTWAFEFENQPYFAGFRALATNGVDLPVLNLFRMLAKMGGKQVAAQSSAEAPLEQVLRDGVRTAPDVAALASLEGDRLCALVWHYHDDDLPGPDAEVELTVTGLPPSAEMARVTHYQIDRDHSNAYTVWQRMGSPQTPTPEQYTELERAGQLTRLGAPERSTVQAGQLKLSLTLPRQGVRLAIVEQQ